MKKRRWYPALLAVTLTVMMVPVLSAQQQDSTQSPSAPEAMPILKKMSEFLAAAGRFSVTIHDGYDVVQESGQKIEFGELRNVTVSRPDRLRIEVERSDGQKGSVIFDGKDITVYTADNNIYATTPRQGTLDQAIKYALDDLKIRYGQNAQQSRQNYATNYGSAGSNGTWSGGSSPGSWGGYYAAGATAGAAGLAMGATVASLPPRSMPIVAQGNPYYYSGGVYYAPQGTNYAVVPPPRGAVIPSIPESSTTVSGAGGTFNYSNGVFYQQASKGYKIVEPPPGILITSLPKGAVTVTVNNVNYREFGGVWYQPFYSGSEIIYQTVPNPTG